MKTDYQKCVIIGPQCSGKSVLIASLLDRLEKSPETLDENAEKWRGIRTEGLSSKILMPFPLEQVLDEMSNRGHWPEQTNSLMGIRWSAVRGKAYGKIWHKIERDFIDIPGERFADFMGLNPGNGKNSYASWSEGVLDNFPKNSDPLSVKWKTDAYSCLREARHDGSLGDYVEAYKETMKEAANRRRYLITPSTLITRMNRGQDDKAFPHHFAPMPKDFRDQLPVWTEQLEQTFNDYQKQVLSPLRKVIKQADVIVIPIDVGWILASGLSAFTDYQELLKSLAFYLESINGFMKRAKSRIINPFSPRWVRERSVGSLRKIIICGTKLDIFAPADRGKVEDLIRKMTDSLRRKADLSGVEIKYLGCSAVNCSTPHEDDPTKLKGYYNGEKVEVKPTELPSDWPDTWDPKAYSFAIDFDPRMNRNGLVPPPNLHLKQLYEELES